MIRPRRSGNAISLAFVHLAWIKRQWEMVMGKGILLWLIGIPIPVIIILWLIFR